MHLQKITRAQVPGISEELERTEAYKTYCDKAKHNISWSVTPENYDLVQDDRSIVARLEDRLKGLKCLNRTDVKVLGQWVVTMPEDMELPQRAKFFKTIYDHMCEIYGKENVIYAKVHLDEWHPHMHVGIVPVSKDRICAKEVFTKEHLKTFHSDMQKYCEEHMKCSVALLNGASLGVDGIQNYKKAAALKYCMEALEDKVVSLKDIDTDISKGKARLTILNADIKKKEKVLDTLLPVVQDHPDFGLNLINWLRMTGRMPFFSKETDKMILQSYKQDMEQAKQEIEHNTDDKTSVRFAEPHFGSSQNSFDSPDRER